MPSTPEIDEQEIIAKVLAGHVNAFEHLLKRYQAYVTKIVIRHVPHDQVEELTHEAFIRAYKSLPTFKHTSSFQHWLASIAVRTCYDFWRQRYRDREMPVSTLSREQQHWLESVIAGQSEQSFQVVQDQKEAQAILEWALNKLSAEDRMVVELVYLEELSGKEAAELLGWSVSNVKVRSFRARKKLRKLLHRYKNDI